MSRIDLQRTSGDSQKVRLAIGWLEGGKMQVDNVIPRRVAIDAAQMIEKLSFLALGVHALRSGWGQAPAPINPLS